MLAQNASYRLTVTKIVTIMYSVHVYMHQKYAPGSKVKRGAILQIADREEVKVYSKAIFVVYRQKPNGVENGKQREKSRGADLDQAQGS